MKSLGSTIKISASVFFAIAILLTIDRSAEAFEGGTWVRLPADGLVTGRSGGLGPLAVCRSPFDNGEHPGKLWEGQCNFGWGGREHRSSNFVVLRSNGYTWKNPGNFVNSSFGGQPVTQFVVALPNNAVDGGDGGDHAGHSRLGICQAVHATGRTDDKTWHPGKFYHNKCNIAWGNEEVAVEPDAFGNVLVLVK